MGGVWVEYQEDYVPQPMAFAKSESITSESDPEPHVNKLAKLTNS